MSDIGSTPQGAVPAIGVPNSQDYPRLVLSAPYFEPVALAELIAPAVTEAVEAQLPSLVPPYVNQAAQDAVNQLAVLIAGSTMQGPLFLNPVMPTQPSQAASMAYVDSLVATAGIPEVPPTPIGQVWARMTGQWTPISEEGGTFLPIGGGTMQGQINMSGNAIVNLPALPVMPNGAAPAQWVLQQIASTSLYQGTWNMDTYTPDLTQLSTHVNGWTWIAITTSASGVVIGPPIPGLQGQTVFNGDTVIYSATAGAFQSIHSGGLTLAEANALYLSLNGGQLSGPLLLNANATQPTQAVTLQQLQTLVAGYVAPDAPTDGQAYLRVGATQGWTPGLPLTGGVTTGAILLSGNAANALQAVPYQQLVSYTAAQYLPLVGGNLTGPLVLAGNASAPLNPVTLTQLTSMLGSYLPLAGGTVSGNLTVNGTSVFSQNVSINLSNAIIQAFPTTTPLWLGGIVNPVLGIDNWQGGNVMLFRGANGSPSSPSALAPGQSIGDICWLGWVGPAYQPYPGSIIRPSPDETWTGAAQGTQMAFGVTPDGMIPAAGFANMAWPLTLRAAAVTIAGSVAITYGVPSQLTINGGAQDSSINIQNQTREWLVGCAISGGGLYIFDQSAGTYAFQLSPDQGPITASANLFQFTGWAVPTVSGAGYCGSAVQAWGAMTSFAYDNASDPRDKRDMTTAPAGALEKVKALRVINYRWNEGITEDRPRTHTGFDVTELHAVHPDAVSLDKDGAPHAYTISDINGLLWQAVQELTAKVEALEAKAAA